MYTKIKTSALCAKELNETSYHVNHECNYASLAEFITETIFVLSVETMYNAILKLSITAFSIHDFISDF
jgi:hypothetical protein